LGLGSYGEGLLIRDLLLTIWCLLLRTEYLVLAIGRVAVKIEALRTED